jgi:uncharacterized protein (DUF1810 family)
MNLRHGLISSTQSLARRYRECVGLVHGDLCKGGVPPLVLMGSEVDVLKLRSSLELFLKVAPDTNLLFREQSLAVLTRLEMADYSRLRFL